MKYFTENLLIKASAAEHNLRCRKKIIRYKSEVACTNNKGKKNGKNGKKTGGIKSN